MNEGARTVLSHLNTRKRYAVMTALRGPDLEKARQAKLVFPSRIRYLADVVSVLGAIIRRRPLEKRDASALRNEMIEWLPVAEQKDKFGRVVRDSFGHFFLHAKRAMEALAGLPSAFIAEEERHEVRALAELAEILRNRFRYAHAHEGESVSLLNQEVFGWAARWYPTWGADWLPIE